MKKVVLAVAAIVFAVVSFSCTQKLGWGVVIWSWGERDAGISGYLPSGTLVPIYIRSSITKTFVVGAVDGKTKLELPVWQVQLFASKNAASKYSKEFASFASLYGVTDRDGIEVKAAPSAAEAKVYRLKEKQVVKLLGKVPEAYKLESGKAVKGIWYEALTDDGTYGYLPSEGLVVFDERQQGAEAALAAQKPTDDPSLDMVFAKSWRPESFGKMIAEGRYDLEVFSSRYGFFADKTLMQLTLELPDLSSVSQYSSITKIKENSYKFDGSPIQVIVRGSRILTLQYIEANGATKSIVLVEISQDIDALVLAETDKRQIALDLLISKGPVLKSSSYGTLKFEPNGGFAWSGYGPLSPEAIPSAAGESGFVSFKLYPGDGIAGICVGVLSFRFNGMAPKSSVDFLYRFSGKGIQLEYSPPICAEGMVVERRSSNPMIAYFEKAEN